MDRRSFLHLAAVSPLLKGEPAHASKPESLPDSPGESALPTYRIISSYARQSGAGMPGALRGQVVRIHSAKSIDPANNLVEQETVTAMVSAGIRTLTGSTTDLQAWQRFVTPTDTVGIKVNCSGAPKIMSSPEVVKAIVDRVLAAGVPPAQIFIYERFEDQLKSVGYDRFVPPGVNIGSVESARGSILGYDPHTYVDTNFFGEDDTRSNLVRLVSQKFTKVINVPNMKEHRAAGVTGCLKNIAYGNFSNVARSHRWEKTNTFSFIGTLASVEPLRSRAVLHVMDGLRGVWHGGPFSEHDQFRFYPQQLMIGTDPVAMDRLLIDVIDNKRKQECAPSVFDRTRERVKNTDETDPAYNSFIREPGHIEYAAHLGLGEYDISKIQLRTVEL